ncbi:MULTISPECIES: DUF6660 family protein [Flavobacteriaceae]|uniref:DUF6660 family protein n=1 Tax=Autumnicola patrickiae TaxID=3075591 RepID=A0ABU3E5P7_9FLAO|nr:DUF6660 family protein [Salegentibacter sp. F188]MDT0691327.1 DUF6660 family protein [Salegentibacter sp. F188]
MKFFAVILSVYFLGLNFIPCDDTAVSENQDTVSVSMEIYQDQPGDQQGTSDDCPPFCQCHCCHIHLVRSTPSAFEIFEPKIPFLTPLFGERVGKEIAFSHFQPPRV